MPPSLRRLRMLSLLAALLLGGMPLAGPAVAEPALTVVDAAGATHSFAAGDLLARPDAASLMVKGDPAYGDAAPVYRVVPLAKLLDGMPTTGTDVVKATALDGFVAQLPAAKVLNTDPAGAIAYVAVEDPRKPWPNFKGKDAGAGPFYLVWVNGQLSGIGPEAWPYQMAKLEFTTSVASRYPAILVAGSLAADAPARRGQTLFIDNCFTCHRMNGAGEAEVGPDLNLPMNPTEYFQPAALARYIRDPASVRNWPDQKMPPFAPDVLKDADIADIVAYLGHMAGRR